METERDLKVSSQRILYSSKSMYNFFKIKKALYIDSKVHGIIKHFIRIKVSHVNRVIKLPIVVLLVFLPSATS